MKFFPISLGCPKNLVDTEIMLGLLIQNNHKIVFDEKDADIVLINTCAFIDSAVNEAESIIYKYKHKKIIIAGCLVQKLKQNILTQFPFVYGVIGVGGIDKINEIIHGQIYIPPVEKFNYNKMPRLISTMKHTAYLRIADGCNNHCSYCLIPSLRGNFRSRKILDIINEAKKLVNIGVKEINLIAQDTTMYGFDLYKEFSLTKLLNRLNKINKLKWIRILYTYPYHFTNKLIDTIAYSEKICKYIDIPFQHIDDSMLKIMNRKGNSKFIKLLITKLRTKIPKISLRTTLLVGHPQETDKKFKKLLEFVKEIEFDHLGVFIYNKVHGTNSYLMKNQIPKKIKEERFYQLMELQKQISLKKNKNYLGQVTEVVIEKIENNLMIGRTSFQAPDIDGIVYIKGKGKIGEFIKVKITKVDFYNLWAESITSQNDKLGKKCKS